MQHPWDNSTIFYQQDKESAIGVPPGTFDAAAMRRQNKRETRFSLE